MKVKLHGVHGEGLYTLVDDDMSWMLKYKWCVTRQGYAYCNLFTPLALHHMVLGVLPDRHHPVDHINRNKLDNRKRNLRVASPSENGMNRKLNRNNTTGEKYVYREIRGGQWTGQYVVMINNKHLGTFKTLADATGHLAHIEEKVQSQR